jgi:hypothetical protein
MIFLRMATQFAIAQCAAAPGAPALDHAIIVARDVDDMANDFRASGFRIKRGRLHANGLDNRHIKFPDGSGIELMTVRGEGTDAMAKRYVDLMNAGDGGAYVALKVDSVGDAERVGDKLELSTRRSGSGPWQFLGFNAQPVAAVFFMSGDAVVQDADSVFAHEPRVSTLAEVWLEGGEELITLLRSLGAVDCDRMQSPDGRVGRRLGLRKGSVVIVPMREGQRPRVIGAVLTAKSCVAERRHPIPSFWISISCVLDK